MPFRENLHWKELSVLTPLIDAEIFKIDVNGDGEIQLVELKNALHTVGVKLPEYKVRELIQRYNTTDPQKMSLSLEEFNEVRRPSNECFITLW